MGSFQQFLLPPVILIFVFASGYSQVSTNSVPETKETKEIEVKLELINKQIEKCFQKNQIDSLVHFYTAACYYLPEYKQAITSAEDLKCFYHDWLDLVSVTNYEKKIFEVRLIGSYVCETGTYQLNYRKQKSGHDDSYTGKYMIMWKRNEKGSLQILSEIFGSDKPASADDMPYAQVIVKGNDLLKKTMLSKKLFVELGDADSVMVHSILNGDGVLRAKGFAENGIYMPHFDKMKIGMQEIRPYMIRTYQKGPITAVVNTYHEIFDAGDLVFVDGHFKVYLETSSDRSTFEGDMSNLMIRENGKLLMFRQLAHNDGEQTSVPK